MSVWLEIRHYRQVKTGGELSLTLAPGQILGVFGRLGAGQAEFLRAVAGLEKPKQGMFRRTGKVYLAGAAPMPRRMRLDGIAKSLSGPGNASRAAEAIAATGLWDARKRTPASLNPGEEAAAEVMAALASQDPVLALEGQLDRLDPWVRAASLELLERRLREGAAAVVATNDPDFLLHCDLVVVWRSRMPHFAGTPDEMRRRHGPVRLTIETLRSKAVRALCDPFAVGIESNEEGLSVTSDEGQALAARLLQEGYGDVRAVVVRGPTPREMIEGLA